MYTRGIVVDSGTTLTNEKLDSAAVAMAAATADSTIRAKFILLGLQVVMSLLSLGRTHTNIQSQTNFSWGRLDPGNTLKHGEMP